MRNPLSLRVAAVAAVLFACLPSPQAAAQTASQAVSNWEDGRVQAFKNGLKVYGLNYAIRSATATTDSVLNFDTEISSNAASNGIFEELMAASSVQAGRMIIFKKSDSTGNAVTVLAKGTDKIDGVVSVSLTSQYDSLVLQSDGVSNWLELSGTVHVGNMTGQHLVGNSAAPTLTVTQGGCGTPSATFIGPNSGLGPKATDLSGIVGETCGSTGVVSATNMSIAFSVAYLTPPSCSLTPELAAAASIPVADAQFAQTTTAKLLVKTNTTGLPSGSYAWYYLCAQ